MLQSANPARRPLIAVFLAVVLGFALVGTSMAGDGSDQQVIQLSPHQLALLKDGNKLLLLGNELELTDAAGHAMRRFPAGSTVDRTAKGALIVHAPNGQSILVGLLERVTSEAQLDKLQQGHDAAEAAEAVKQIPDAAQAIRNQTTGGEDAAGKGGLAGGSSDTSDHLALPNMQGKGTKSNQEKLDELTHASGDTSVHVDRGGLVSDRNDDEEVDIPEAPEKEPEEGGESTGPPEIEHKKPEREHPERREPDSGQGCEAICQDQPGSAMCHQCTCREHPDAKGCDSKALPGVEGGGASTGEFQLPKGMRQRTPAGITTPCQDCNDGRGGTDSKQGPRVKVNLGDTPTGAAHAHENEGVPAELSPEQVRDAVKGGGCQDCPSSGVSRGPQGPLAGASPQGGAVGQQSAMSVGRLQGLNLHKGQSLKLTSGHTLIVRGRGKNQKVGLQSGKGQVQWLPEGAQLLKNDSGHLFVRLASGKTAAVGESLAEAAASPSGKN